MTRSEYKKGDYLLLLPHLRKSDQEYLTKIKAVSPLEALRSFETADHAWTFTSDGEVAACLAVRGQNLWLQTTELTDSHPLQVVRECKKMDAILPRELYVVVPEEDVRVRRICRTLGFTTQTAEYENYCNSGIKHVALWRT